MVGFLFSWSENVEGGFGSQKENTQRLATRNKNATQLNDTKSHVHTKIVIFQKRLVAVHIHIHIHIHKHTQIHITNTHHKYTSHINKINMVRHKYLSTTEMVTGFERKTNLPIQQITPQPGDLRVYRPTKYDVLCGRGAPIQNHEGNVRMRRLVSKYTKRYMDSRKYRKQLVAEEAVRRVKRTGKGRARARFLRRVGRENYWEEVDDRIASDKVSHALRCFVRKLEEGSETLVSDADDGSSTGTAPGAEESDAEELTPSLPQEATIRTEIIASTTSATPTPAPIPSSVLEKSASGVQALKRVSPLHAHPPAAAPSLGFMPLSTADPLLTSRTSLATLPPTMLAPAPPGVHAALPAMLPPRIITPPMPPTAVTASGLPISAAEAELDYRMSLQRMSTRGLLDLVAVERAQRTGVPPPPPPPPPGSAATATATDPLSAASLASGAALATARMEQQLLHQRLLSRARLQDLLVKESILRPPTEAPRVPTREVA